MNVEALRRLAELLENVQRHQDLSQKRVFDLSCWLNDDSYLTTQVDETEAVLKAPPEARVETLFSSCGTTACAAGFAGLDPWFISQGFSIDKHTQPLYVDPEGNKFHGWDAIYEFFELDYGQAQHLFSEYTYRDADWDDPMPEPVEPHEVVDRIRTLILTRT